MGRSGFDGCINDKVQISLAFDRRLTMTEHPSDHGMNYESADRTYVVPRKHFLGFDAVHVDSLAADLFLDDCSLFVLHMILIDRS